MPAKFQLDNGLSVLLLESHKAPVISAQMWVRTGSADEQAGEEGISHFIEHLVFKGSDKYGVGEIAAVVEKSGGELNAYTSFDQTVFYVTISKEFTNVALDVISQMMGHPRFDSDEIDNEREVVIEEIKRSNDSLSRRASRLLFETCYQKHPYRIPVIGYDSVVRSVSRETIVDYYQRRYRPSNMFLVVSGDFQIDEMKKKVTDYFSTFEPGPVHEIRRRAEPEQDGARITVQKSEFEETLFHLAWRIPGARNKDIPALDVLSLIMGQGESSRLYQKLRVQEHVANSIGMGTFTPMDEGVLTISGSLNIDRMSDMLDALLPELELILSEAPGGHELEKAIRNFESDEIYSMETVDGLARKAGQLEHLFGDYNYFKKFLKQISELKGEDLVAVARKYMAPERLSMIGLVPRDEEKVTELFKSWLDKYTEVYDRATVIRVAPVAAPATKRVDVDLTAPERSDDTSIERVTLSSGVRVLLRPSKSTPLMSIKTGFLGGLRAEGGRPEGLTELLSRAWPGGSKLYTEQEIQRTTEHFATSLGSFGGRNTVGLSLSCLSQFETDLRTLFLDSLSQPVFPENVVEREKQAMLEAVKSRFDHPGFVVSHLFLKSIFANHPYSRDLEGNEESIPKLNQALVQDYWRELVNPENAMFVLTGLFDRDAWLNSLEGVTKGWSANGNVAQSIQLSPLTESTRHYEPMKKEQSHIILGYRALDIQSPDRFKLKLIQSILAGQGGRLFIELRDKASLAYTVAPMRLEGVDTGYFGAYIGCSPEKGAKAIEMMRVEFKKLMSEPVGSAELDRAKRYLIGRHDIDLQRNSAIASSLLFNEIYGIPAEETFAFADKIKGVSSEDLMKLAQQLFSQPEVLCAVGSVSPF